MHHCLLFRVYMCECTCVCERACACKCVLACVFCKVLCYVRVFARLVCVCASAFVFVSVWVCECACISVFACVYMCVYVCVCMCKCVRVCVCVSAYVRVWVHVCMCGCECVRAILCARACMHGTCVRACVRGYMRVGGIFVWDLVGGCCDICVDTCRYPLYTSNQRAGQRNGKLHLSCFRIWTQNNRVQQDISLSNSHIHVPFLRKRSPQQTHYIMIVPSFASYAEYHEST